jgi:hypothetical protein
MDNSVLPALTLEAVKADRKIWSSDREFDPLSVNEEQLAMAYTKSKGYD